MRSVSAIPLAPVELFQGPNCIPFPIVSATNPFRLLIPIGCFFPPFPPIAFPIHVPIHFAFSPNQSPPAAVFVPNLRLHP
jgi:hypothetical protein